MSTPATRGWYSDGTPGVLRWFDGQVWTDQTSEFPDQFGPTHEQPDDSGWALSAVAVPGPAAAAVSRASAPTVSGVPAPAAPSSPRPRPDQTPLPLGTQLGYAPGFGYQPPSAPGSAGPSDLHGVEHGRGRAICAIIAGVLGVVLVTWVLTLM